MRSICVDIRNYYLALILATGIPTANAEEAAGVAIPTARVTGGEFREGFRDQLNVSSSVILGLSLGTSTGVGSLDQVIINKSGMPQAKHFCLRAMSVDGLFWAENPYAHDTNSDFVRTEPVSKKHATALKDYGVQNILVTAGFSDVSNEVSCSDSNLIYAPVVDDPNELADELTVFINSENRFTHAQLRNAVSGESSDLLAETTCVRAAVVTAAIYDKVCVFKLDEIPSASVVELKLSFSAGPFGTDDWIEKIMLPARRQIQSEQ